LTWRPTGGSFSPGEANAAPAPHLSGIDALIALDLIERRRREVKLGRRALEALDHLKLDLVAGTIEPAVLLRLKAVAFDLEDGSGD
jgi:hypothetical protein